MSLKVSDGFLDEIKNIGKNTNSKKKKKEEEQEVRIPYSDPLDIAPTDLLRTTARTSFQTQIGDDIAPVKKDEQTIDFFQKGAFEDGYQEGDFLKSIAANIIAPTAGAVKGALGLVEGVTDAIGYGIGAGADLLGLDGVSDGIKDFSKKNLVTDLFSGVDKFTEENSQLGRTTRGITETLGQVATIIATGGAAAGAGVGSAGVTALTTGLMGVSGTGSGISEAYQNKATDEEAYKYGVAAGVIDAVSELVFGGMGKALNAVGFSKGLSSLDDITAKAVGKIFKNPATKNIAEYITKAGFEGLEEVGAGFGQAIAKNLTYMSEEDFWDIVEDENLFEQFVVGAFTSGITQGADLRTANKSGTDFVTGMTQNEQSVVDKVLEDRIAEAEKDGKKVSNRDKNKLYDSIVEEMERGEISLDTIEEVLGGDSYSYYKNTLDKENKALSELAELYEGEELAQQTKDLLDNSETKKLKYQLREEVSELVKNDRIGESYREVARRKQAFQADLTQYDEKIRPTVQKAMESGLLNNTRRAHEFVDIVAKISADRGVSFDFTNNERLRESGFALDGYTVNGVKTDSGIAINMESKQAWQFTVGHEITHVLEGTELYDTLQQTLFDYARSRKATNSKFENEYKERLYNARQTYKDVDGYKGVEGFDKVKKEVASDLVGEYLFQDEKFVKHLSAKNRNVFQKIYDEIKYLAKVVTAGSKEARELEKVRKVFEDAYRSSLVTPNSVENSQYSLRKDAPPKKTQEVYKLMRLKDGEIYPLFIDSTEPLKVGEWYDADSPDLEFLREMPSGIFLVDTDTKTYQSYDEYLQESGEKKTKYPSKTAIEKATADGKRWVYIEDTAKGQRRFAGESRRYWNLGINGSGSVSTFSMRPGYHAGSLPTMRQIGKGKNRDLRDDSFVWTVGEVPADIDYQAEAEQNPDKDIPTHIPKDGYYLKATNADKKKSQADRVGWYVAGAYKINKLISDSEARKIIDDWNSKHPDSPVEYDYDRESGMDFDAEQMKLVPRQYSLTADSNGKKLTNEQREYFKDSVVKDENGNLKVMYHGTSKGGHTVFDTYGSNYGLFGTGSYFTDSKSIAESYTNKGKGNNKQVYETYLNIKNPLDMDAPADADAWAKAFPDAAFPESGTNEQFYRAVEEYYADQYMPKWEVAEEIQQTIQFGMGYDGITHIGGGRVNADGERHRVYIAFEPEQIKDISNGKPTTNPDIRYSLSADSDGKQLTVEQAEYFKNSKMRDADGNLKVMYHGTKDGGFHTFDPDYSDDHTSFFFVDRNDVAQSYSGTSETYAARSFRTADDFNKFFAEIGATEYSVKEKDGKFHLYDDGDLAAVSETADGIYEEFRDWSGLGYGDVNYKVYLNLENPLVVDAKGREWNDIRNWSQSAFVKSGDAEVKRIGNEFKLFNKNTGTEIVGGEISANSYTETIDRNTLRSIMVNKVNNILSIKTENMNTTRDVSKWAKKNGYDGVIFKNILDVGGYGGKYDPHTVAIAFNSEQIKSVGNDKPTKNPDIRYSLSKDSEGRNLSPAVKNRFANTKVVDENGNLKVVYHGTASGEFTIFDKAKGSVEGDFGSGFYFTDDDYDVENNYEGGGPDFDNKVSRRAEQIYNEEDIDYEEAERRAKAELYKGSHRFEVYLNIENPAVVGETILFEEDSYYSQYDQEDYDSEEDYLGDVEQLISDDIDGILWDIERNVDVDSTDGIADILWGAFNEGGIDIEGLKKRINNLYLEDSNGNMVGNEVTRQILESLGYDGIIDPTVSQKFNMGLEESTTHYIVFKPNQIKSVTNQNPTDNPDIRYSVSKNGAQHNYRGKFSTPARDLMLETQAKKQDIAPVTAQENVQNTATVEELFPDDLAPIYSELTNLYAKQKDLENKMVEVVNSGDYDTFAEVDAEYKTVMERIAELQAEENAIDSGRLNSLSDSDVPPEADAPYPGEPTTNANPFKVRDISDVGSQKVKAYQFENPEVKPYFTEAAYGMLDDLNNTTKGERWYNDQLYYDSGGEKGFFGTKRQTTDDIAELLDTWHYTYDQIRDGLNAIIEDNGKENNAVSKRIEFMLDERLRSGYTTVYGEPIPANQEYINLLNEKQINEYSAEAFRAYMESVGNDVPPEMNVNDIAPMPSEKPPVKPAIAPEAKKEFEAIRPKQTQPKLVRADKALTRKELHESIIDRIKQRFFADGIDFDDVLKSAKDLSTFATVDNTPQRVMEKSLGYKNGKILSDLTVDQAARNETDGIRWLNSYTDRKNGVLAQLSKEYGIKPGSKESAAAQMYAEGFYVNERNEIVKYGDRELAIDFPDYNVRENIKGLANDPVIRQIYDETLAMINESRTRNAYPEIQKLENYFLHFRAMDDTFSRLGLPFNPNDIRAKDLPTDLNGVTADLKPGQPYFASAMHRRGMRTSFDLLGGLERYLTSAKNQIYHIDDIQTLRALRNYVADTYGQAKGLDGLDLLSEEETQERIQQVYNSHLSTFAKFLNEEANILAGKTALIDRGLEGIIGRRGITFLDTLNKQVGSNMVGYNVSSSLTNLLSAVQGFAKTNKSAFVKGFAQTVSNKIGSIYGNGDGFAEASPVMVRRKGADRFYRTPWQKLSDPGYAMMGAIDNFSTELITRAKFNELTQKGMDSDQAHIETDKWVSRLMGDRSLGQMPQLYNSKMLGLLTKFQLEVRNQLDSQFYDTIQEAKVSVEDIANKRARNAKLAAKVSSTFFQLAVGQHLFGKAFESIAGYNPAFDIISVLATALGFDDEEESEDTALDNIEQAFLELMGDLPYTSTLTGGRIPIESAAPVTQFFTGKDKYGNEKSRLETVLEAAPYWFMPGGYSQAKKTAQGLGMFSDDHPIAGSYTDSGNLRFPVEDTLGNRVQAGLFGQWSSENARDYFDNERSALKPKQIQEFIDSGMKIQDYWAYRDGLKEFNTLAEKVDYIYSLNLPIETKNILVNNLTTREDEIDLTGYDNYSSFEEFEYAKEYPENYAVSKAVGGYDAWRQYSSDLYDIKADKDENGKSISGSRKEKVFDYINGLNADYGEKIILFKSEYPADDTYNYEIIDYLNSRDDISREEMETILKKLGFTVYKDGTVEW